MLGRDKLTLCFVLHEDSETSKCSLSGNRTHEVDPFCGSRFPANVTCHRNSTSTQDHNHGDKEVTLMLTPVLGDDCSFDVKFVAEDDELF